MLQELQNLISVAPTTTAASAEQALGLMLTRRTVRPKNMTAPGPDASQLAQILGAAAHAPDHGRTLPWRLVQVPESARDALAQVFVDALLEREADASEEQIGRAREKAYRSPELLLMVVKEALADEGDAPRSSCDSGGQSFAESCAAAGCALQNMMLVATALGFASGLTSGGSLQAKSFRAFFGLLANEHAICFVSFGTLSASGQKSRGERPAVEQYFSVLQETAECTA